VSVSFLNPETDSSSALFILIPPLPFPSVMNRGGFFAPLHCMLLQKISTRDESALSAINLLH